MFCCCKMSLLINLSAKLQSTSLVAFVSIDIETRVGNANFDTFKCKILTHSLTAPQYSDPCNLYLHIKYGFNKMCHVNEEE